MQLARPAAALRLGRLQRMAQALVLDGLRERDSSTWPVVEPSIGTFAPIARAVMPALAATTRSSPSRSRITRLRASTSARPRLAISSSTVSSSISAPTATAIVRAASSRRASCSSSSRRAATAS